MSWPIQEQMEQAIADLRTQQERLRTFQAELAEMSTTVLSKNRMVEATVDSGGKLNKLVFKGNRYRNLAPAEFAALVVATVAQAQTEAQTATMAKAASLMPGRLRLPDLGAEDLDLGRVFDEAIAQAGLPFPGEGKDSAPAGARTGRRTE